MFLILLLIVLGTRVDDEAVKWAQCLEQARAWYKTEDAIRIADNVLLYQRDSGGWPKNIDMATKLTTANREEIGKQKTAIDSTIDNDATYTQMEYLARVFDGTQLPRFKTAFEKGFDFLIRAQYPNGGWPQFYPNPEGYHRHITYNDDAMAGVLTLLKAIADQDPYYSFVDQARRDKAEDAVKRGVECILKTQIIVNGKRTVWCAQHDEVTLAPADARSYEKASFSGLESAGIVRFLMSLDHPNDELVDSIQSAVAWFESKKIWGIRLERRPDKKLPNGFDLFVVNDSSSEPLWARFYELGTGRPIFCGRDGVIKYSLAEIEHERRTGYNWYTNAPSKLLTREYPNWQKKWLPGRSKAGSE